jgi:hypothetical protein
MSDLAIISRDGPGDLARTSASYCEMDKARFIGLHYANTAMLYLRYLAIWLSGYLRYLGYLTICCICVICVGPQLARSCR